MTTHKQISITKKFISISVNRFLGCGMFMLALLFLGSCEAQRIQTITWTEYEPVYMEYNEFLAAAGVEEARELEEPGKIYLFGDYLFVSEIKKGIHVINNQNPASPQNMGFINIPGNHDMAIRGNRLYADSSDDLLVFDISDLQHPELISRKKDVFNMTVSQFRGHPYRATDPSKGVVVDWEPVEVTDVCEGDCRHRGGGWGRGIIALEAGSFSDGGGSATGTGGSMARFTISGDHLYVVDWSRLITFEISGGDAVKQDQQNVGWMIETIFPYQDNLFIGSGNSMYIYDISQPASPELLSAFRHATACDPVVVENDYAYVTLRDGDICPNVQGTNHLEVIDVKDLVNPKRVGKYDMQNPHGLGIDNGKLFISEGDYGLKIMDASDPLNLKDIRHIKEIRTYDVISNDGILIVTGASGIIQYDYSDIDNIKELGRIPVK